MNDREHFEAEVPKEVKSGNFTEVFYTNNEYEAAYDGWQACSKVRQAELDKANARLAQLEESLKQYVDSDEILEGGHWEKENKFWLDIKRNAQKLLSESSDTWLSEHDKAVVVETINYMIESSK